MAADVLAKMAVIIEGQTADFNKKLSDSSSSLNAFTKNLTEIASGAAAAFGVSEIASFGLEVSKLAGQAEGVERAFALLPSSKKVLEELTEATHGTVGELGLMEQAVKANNFNIGLDVLPKLLEFATLRAQQTGQSINDLVDAIVNGIGRKSTRILDTLGISSSQLKEKLGGVSLEAAGVGKVSEAVGQIAEESLKNMATYSDNAASRLDQLSASWEDAKVAIGKAANSTGAFGLSVQLLKDNLDTLSGKSEVEDLTANLAGYVYGDFTGSINAAVAKLKELRKEAGTPLKFDAEKYIHELGLSTQQAETFRAKLNEINNTLSVQELRTKIFSDFAKGYSSIEAASKAFAAAQLKEIDNTTFQIDNYKKLDEAHASPIYTKLIEQLNDEITARYALIHLAEDEAKAKNTSATSQVTTITTLEATLKEYQDQVLNTDVTDVGAIATLNKKSQALKEQIEYLKILVPLSNAAKSDAPITKSVTPQDFTFSDSIVLPDNFSDKMTSGLQKVNDAFAKSKRSGKDWSDTMQIYQDEVKAHTIDLGPAITQGLSGFADALGQAAAGVGNFGQNILTAISGFMKSFGEQLIALGTAAIAADVLIEDPYTALAAGLALVAIAGATAGLLSNTQKGISSVGKSGSASSSASSNAVAASSDVSSSGLSVDLSGQFTVRGQDLFLIFNRQQALNNRTK